VLLLLWKTLKTSFGVHSIEFYCFRTHFVQVFPPSNFVQPYTSPERICRLLSPPKTSFGVHSIEFYCLVPISSKFSRPPISSNPTQAPNAFAGFYHHRVGNTQPPNAFAGNRKEASRFLGAGESCSRWLGAGESPGERICRLPITTVLAIHNPRTLLQATEKSLHSFWERGARESPGEGAHCFPTLQFHPRASSMSGQVNYFELRFVQFFLPSFCCMTRPQGLGFDFLIHTTSGP